MDTCCVQGAELVLSRESVFLSVPAATLIMRMTVMAMVRMLKMWKMLKM